MSEVHVCAPVFNETTHLFENQFLSYWVETKYLKELYNDVFQQQDELTIHFEDKEEQERISKERDDAIMEIHQKNHRSKKDNECDYPDVEPDPDDTTCEHES